jgi:hypothetical protein
MIFPRIKRSGQMDKTEFKEFGYKFIDWVSDYLNGIEKSPVLSQVRPGEIRSKLPKKTSGSRRVYGGGFPRFSRNHSSGNNSLAASFLVCLFPCQ